MGSRLGPTVVRTQFHAICVFQLFAQKDVFTNTNNMDGPIVFCFCLVFSLLLDYFLGIHSQSEITESEVYGILLWLSVYTAKLLYKGLPTLPPALQEALWPAVPVLRWGSASRVSHSAQ